MKIKDYINNLIKDSIQVKDSLSVLFEKASDKADDKEWEQLINHYRKVMLYISNLDNLAMYIKKGMK